VLRFSPFRARRIALGAFFALAAALPPAVARLAVAAPQTVQAIFAPADTSNAAAFDAVWDVLEKRFYDETLRGLGDTRATREAYRVRAAALAPDDEAGFAALVNEMLGKLNASHTRLFTPDDFEYYLLPALMTGGGSVTSTSNRLRHIGALTRPNEPGRIAAVLNGSPGALVGLRPGDTLVSVDGVPYHGLTQFGANGKGSNATVLVPLVYRRGSGSETTVMVTPVRENPLDALYEATRRSVTAWNLPGPGGKIGYVRLWTMAQPRFAQFLEETVRGPLHNTDALVLDLRDGFGGSPDGYADVFFRPDFAVWHRGRDGKAGQTVWNGYAKPLVVLINRGTRSAKEILAWTLRQNGRAVLVGEKTAGAVLAAQGVPIANGRFYLSYAMINLALNGERLEGRGVVPDVVVPAGSDEAAWQKSALDALAAALGRPLRQAVPLR